MITQRDHDFIVNLDSRGQKDLPDKQPEACADVLLGLLTHISKDHTIQYILVLIDDILSVSKLTKKGEMTEVLVHQYYVLLIKYIV